MTTPTIARVPRADAATLCGIVADVVHTPCCTFSGSVLWDIDRDNKANNLRTIKQVPEFTAKHLRGDFGHAFNDRAEVRWKRLGHNTYDVLILSEHVDVVLPQGAYQLPVEVVQVRDPNQQSPKEQVAIRLDGSDHNGHRLRYVEYIAGNGAVLLVRYRGFLKESQQ
jgi:hypothetical protein